jgi:hypothetical protein
MAQAILTFLPWVRGGLAATIDIDDSLKPQKAQAKLDVVLAINGAPEPTANFVLNGPADVTGINPNQIVRREPRPGTTDFEPNYFACIEFDRPDFPWIFTPAKADGQGRIRPWLSLIVVRDMDGVAITPLGDSPLPVLTIAASLAKDELPDPDEVWGWAHVQVAADAFGDVGQALDGAPERSLSRLICPRLLEPLTNYIACVVPSFEPGARSGLGTPLTQTQLQAADALKPSWARSGEVRLPVYHHWSFRTGTAGDFETLARGLVARQAPAALGHRPVDITEPGFTWAAPPDQRAIAVLEGALRPIVTAPSATLPGDFQEQLAAIINAPVASAAASPDADPLVAPPLYGRWHASQPAASSTDGSWYSSLNLDPMRRAVAAFGTKVVQDNQEALMAAAWKQAADLKRTNQRLRQIQLGIAVGTRLVERHFESQPDAAVFRLATPAFSRLKIDVQGAATTSETLLARVRTSSLPESATSPAMRRLGRARGPLTRRFAARGVVRIPENWLHALDSANTGTSTPPAAYLPSMATVGAVLYLLPQGSAIESYGNVRDDTLAVVPGRPGFVTVPEGQAVPVTPLQPGTPVSSDSPAAAAFREAASEHLKALEPGRMTIMVARPAPIDVPELRHSILDQLKPRAGLINLVRAIIAPAENASPVIDTPRSEPAGVDMVYAYPHFPTPMYGPLRDLSQNLLLPGLEDIPPETVLGLATNREFIESYMLGLNVEMARELLWRGYHTDQLGTYFDQFWDASTSPSPRPDIARLTAWGGRPLGENSPVPLQDQFVMLIRSALLRRYPNAIIFAAPTIVTSGARKPDLDLASAVHPAFRGSADPDVSFFGFDLAPEAVAGTDGGDGYFLIIQEHPGEPRFGLDEYLPPIGTSHLAIGSAPPTGHDVGIYEWGHNGAHMAGAVRQLPVMVAIHASRFVTSDWTGGPP